MAPLQWNALDGVPGAPQRVPSWAALGVGLVAAAHGLLGSAAVMSCGDVRPRDMQECQATWRDCRLQRRPIPRALFSGCLEHLGWLRNETGLAPQPCTESVGISMGSADSSTCDDLAISVDAEFVKTGTCFTLEHWLNRDCTRCDSWKLHCGCTWPRMANAKPTCRDQHGRERTSVLHGELCSPQCMPGFATHHSGPLRCYDRRLLTSDAPDRAGGGRPAGFACYNSAPWGAPAGELRWLDEDPRLGVASGTLRLSGAVPDASGFAVYWGYSATARLGARIATVPSASSARLSLRIPEAATHILAFPENLFGEAPVAWSAPALDLHVEAGSAGAGELAAHEAFSFEVAGAPGASHTAPWTLGPGLGECGSMPLSPASVRRFGGGDRLGWSLPAGLPGGPHTLCRLEVDGLGAMNLKAAGVLWVRSALPRLVYEGWRWLAGASRHVEVVGEALEAWSSALVLLPAGSRVGRGCSAAGAVRGRLVRTATRGSGAVQEWRVRPPSPGSYRLCWEGCPGTPWTETCPRVESHEDIVIAGCEGSLSLGAAGGLEPTTQPCVKATSSTCATLSQTIVDSSSCLHSFPEGWIPPLVSRRLDVAVPQRGGVNIHLSGFQLQCDFDDRLISACLAPDMSYLLLAVPAGRSLYVLRLGGGPGPTLFDKVLQSYSRAAGGIAEQAAEVLPIGHGGSCEFLLPDVVSDLGRGGAGGGRPLLGYVPCGDDGGSDAKNVSFQRPTAVRIAPSGAFWLVADAWSHRVRRIDVSTWSVRTVAGSGQASSSVRRLAYKDYRAQVGLGFLYILEGCFRGDGGLAVQAQLNMPSDVAIFTDDEDRFLIADRMNHRVRQVSSGGVITTVAGVGPPGLPLDCNSGVGDGGPAAAAQLFEPTGVELVPGGSGVFLIAERVCHRIRWVAACGTIHTLPSATALHLPVQPRITASGSDILVMQDCSEASDAAQDFRGCQGEASRSGLVHSMPLPPKLLDGVDCAQTASHQRTPVFQEMPLRPLRFFSIGGQIGSEEAYAVAAGVGNGVDGSLYVISGSDGSVLEISRRPLPCPHRQEFDIQLRRCICQKGMRNFSGTCTPCSPGHTCDGSSLSLPCPGMRTTFRRASLFGGIRRCAMDMPAFNLSEGTTCLDTAGAATTAECACPHGLYSNSSSHSCRACPGIRVDQGRRPEGLLCTSGLSPSIAPDTVRLQNGFWAEIATDGRSYGLFQCHRASACWWTSRVNLWNASARHGCGRNFTAHCAAQGGRTGGRPNTCSHNREGFNCGRCAAGFVEDNLGRCMECGGAANYALAIMKSLLLLLMLAMFYSFLNNPKGGKFMATYMISNTATSLAEFVQQYNLLAMIVLPPLPVIEALLAVLPTMHVALVPAECFWHNLPGARYPWSLALPIGIAGALLVLWVLARLTAARRRRLPEEVPCARRMPAWALGQAQALLAWFKGFSVERDKALNTWGFFLVALHSEITRLSLVPFQTRKHPPPPLGEALPGSEGAVQAPVWTLLRYPDVQQGSALWWIWLPMGILAVLAYTLSIFVLHCAITYRAPQRFVLDASFRTRHKYFYAKYRDDRYYWGLIIMVRGLLNNLLGLSLLEGLLGKLVQAQAMVGINAVFLLLLCVLSPYKNVLNSRLDALLNSVLLCMQVVGTAGSSAGSDRNSEWACAAVLAMCGLASAAALAQLLYAAALPDRASRLRETSAVQLAYVVKSICSRVAKLRSRTLVVIVKSFTVLEREAILRGLRFVERRGTCGSLRVSQRLGESISRLSSWIQRSSMASSEGSRASSSSGWSGLSALSERLSTLRFNSMRASCATCDMHCASRGLEPEDETGEGPGKGPAEGPGEGLEEAAISTLNTSLPTRSRDEQK